MNALIVVLAFVSLSLPYSISEYNYAIKESDLFSWQVDTTNKNKEIDIKKSSRTVFNAQNSELLLNDDQYMFIAIKDRVYRFNSNDINTKLDVLYWPDVSTATCSNQNPILCENRVHTAIKLNQTCFVFCGVKKQEPICEIYTIKDKSELVHQKFNIDEKKLVSKTELPLMQPLVFNNLLYYANDYDSNIWTYNLTKNSVYVQTYQPINKPIFLNSFIFEEKAYYFYREYDTNEKVWLSYASDFCKDEEGRPYKNSEVSYLTTFKKAFLKCLYNDTNGNNKTYTHLEYITKPFKSNVFQLKNESEYVLYASFSSIEEGSYTSAICVFHMDQVIEQINKNVYEKEYLGSLVYSSDDCSTKMSFQDFQAKVGDSRYRLKYPLTSLAIYRSNNTIIKPIDVDTSNNDADVIYVGYSNGRLSKLASYQQKYTNQVKTIILQDYNIFSNSTVSTLIALNNKLIAFNNISINSFFSTNCEQYETCKACVESQDPDCSWVAPDRKCKFKGNGIKNIVDGFSNKCKIEDAKNKKTYFKRILLPIFGAFFLISLIGIILTVVGIRYATKDQNNNDDEANKKLNETA